MPGGGGASPNQNITQTSTTQLPQWYQDVLAGVAPKTDPSTGQPIPGTGQTGLLPQAESLAASPYVPYTGQQVAGFTPAQQASFDRIHALTGSYTPLFSNAQEFANAAGAQNIGAAASPDIASGLSQAADTTKIGLGYLGSGANIAQGLGSQSSPTFQSGLGAAQQGLGYAGQAAAGAYGGAGAASPFINAATMPAGYMAASPYLNAASGSWPGASSAYMNPYVTGANNALAQQFATNLNEFVLPQVSSQFVGLGQSGSPQQAKFESNLINQQMQSLLNQQAGNLNQAYNTGASTYESDAARQAQLAQTAGGLGTAEQQAQLQAGLGLGGLTQSGVQSLLGAGQTAGQLGLGTGQLGLGAGQLGASTLLGAGQNANQTGLGLGQLGISAGNTMANAQYDTGQLQLGAAAQNAALANQWQQQYLKDAAAQNAVGTQQQQLDQTSLNTAYQNFLNQQQYPFQALGFESNIVHGLPVNQSTVYQGPAQQSQLQPNPLSSLIGGGMGVYGMTNALGGNSQGVSTGYKRGGLVKNSRRKASYGRPAANSNAGLGFMEAA